MNRILPVILIITALGLGAFGFSEYRRAETLSGEVSVLKSQVAKLEAEVKKLTVELADAKRKSDILTTEAKALRDRIRNAGSETASTTDANQDNQGRQRGGGRGGRGPQGMMRRAFGDVITKMNLSEEQQNQLFETLTARGQSAGDAVRQAMQNGQTDEASLIAAIKAKNAENDQQLSALLGENYTQFKQAQDSMADTFALGQFQERLTQSGATLQDHQSTALNQVMSEERLKNPASVISALGYFDPRVASALPKEQLQSYIDSQKDYYQRVEQRLTSVLSADQQKTLSESFNRMTQFQQRAMEWSQRRGQDGGDRGGPGGPPPAAAPAAPVQ